MNRQYEDICTLANVSKPYCEPEYNAYRDMIFRILFSGVGPMHASMLNGLLNIWLEEKYGVTNIGIFTKMLERFYDIYFEGARRLPLLLCYEHLVSELEEANGLERWGAYSLIDRPLDKILLVMLSACSYNFDQTGNNIVDELGKVYGMVTAIQSGNFANVESDNGMIISLIPIQDVSLLVMNFHYDDYKMLSNYIEEYLINARLPIDERSASFIKVFNIYHLMSVVISYLLCEDEKMDIKEVEKQMCKSITERLFKFDANCSGWLPAKASKDSDLIIKFMVSLSELLETTDHTLKLEELYLCFNKVWHKIALE